MTAPEITADEHWEVWPHTRRPSPPWSPALTALRRDMDKGATEWRYETSNQDPVPHAARTGS